MASDLTVAQAFLSYAHSDDEFLDGGITWLRRELQRAMQAITGEPFEIFQDADGIMFGEHWPSKIEDALTGARFLIPILTPSYFASPQCRAEAATFLDLEKKAGRQDLILPIYLLEADALENDTLRDNNPVARTFYQLQYADWRDAAYELRNSARIKQRTVDLARQIKAASERVAGDAPPLVQAQGPGPRFQTNKAGKIDRAPDEPAEITDDDPKLTRLQAGLQDACSRFLGSFEGSAGHNVSGAHGQLIDNVHAYQTAITGNLTELQVTDVYLRGVTLQNQMLARSRDVPRMDPPPPLEDEQEAAINDLLTFHANFILSTKDGEILQGQTDRAQLTAEQRASLWSPALADAAQVSDHATERTKAILANVNQPDEDGAVPDRRALLALATNRNFLSATGEAATGKDLSGIGEQAATEAGQSASRFLLKNEKLIKQFATSPAYALTWLTSLTTYLRGRRAPAETVPPAAQDAPAIVTNVLWKPGRIFRDINEPWCPRMVVIPTGKFLMGSPVDKMGISHNEIPRHRVTVRAPFALGQFLITFEEFDFFCDETNRDRPEDEGWGRGSRPVINTSWHDAVAYCDWLSERTNNNYRLPSEAEWEYACRAGSQAAYAFGEGIDGKHANFDRTLGKSSEIGAYPANAFKLFDMHGNVWEWCADHYKDSYADAPTDGRPLQFPKSPDRVVRGGSWYSKMKDLRSACRGGNAPDARNFGIGFRCARVQE